MTDQKIKHSRTAFFQKMKMAERAMEVAKKSLTEDNINNDIFDKVIEMKDCIKEIGNIMVELIIKSKETDMKSGLDIMKEESKLEDVAKKLQEEDKTGSIHDNDKIDDTKSNQGKSHHHTVKCTYCGRSFKNISEVERHIKRNHKEHQTYDCDKCGKEFVTRWRLERHIKMHSKTNLKDCHYYKRKKHCPFEELGCKFGHEINLQLIAEANSWKK